MKMIATTEFAAPGGVAVTSPTEVRTASPHRSLPKGPAPAAADYSSHEVKRQKLFISYNRDSLDAVKALAADLAEEADPWFDQELTGGQRWWDSILARIRGCDTFVFALTPGSVESQACGRECDYARQLGKPVLPVLLSDKVSFDDLPSALAQIQGVDYQAQDKRAYVALMRALAGIPAPSPLPDPLPLPPPVPISYIVSLKERIDSEAPLEYADQITLTLELRDRFRAGRPAEEIVPLLERLKRRDDLLARVGCDIDTVLDEIATRETATAPRKRMGKKEAAAAVRKEAAQEKAPASDLPARISETNGGHLRLDDALDTCMKLMGRVADGERWIFEIDPQNRFTMALDKVGTRRITVNGELRDRMTGTRAKELKSLGWAVKEHAFAKGATGVVALYATGGVAALALFSKSVRNFLMSFEATHSWPMPSDRHTLAGAAAEFALALQRTAPDFKTIIVRKAAD